VATKAFSPYVKTRGKKYYYDRRVPEKWIWLSFNDTDRIRISLSTEVEDTAHRLACDIDNNLRLLFEDIQREKIDASDAMRRFKNIVTLSPIESDAMTIGQLVESYVSLKGTDWSEKGLKDFYTSLDYIYNTSRDEKLPVAAKGKKKPQALLKESSPVVLIDKQICQKVFEAIKKRIDKKTGRPIKKATVNKIFGRLHALLRYAYEILEVIPTNPAHGFTLVISDKEEEESEYVSYTNEDVVNIFHHLLVRPGEPRYKAYKYWLPLLCAHVGGRLGDMHSITPESLEYHHGIACLRMQGAKKQARSRLVPIHSNLLSIGFVEFLKSCPPKKTVFPMAMHYKNGEGGPNYKFYNNVVNPRFRDKKVFHSWRRTISSKLNNINISVTHRADLLGHKRKLDSGEQLQTDRNYTDKTSLIVLKGIVENIVYEGVDWQLVARHLHPELHPVKKSRYTEAKLFKLCQKQ
jgi:integrase